MSHRQFAPAYAGAMLLMVRGTAPLAAAAQAAPADQGVQLQEITVTATRVQTPAERTPVSLEVYSSADLAREDIHDLASLAAADPSLQYSPNGGRGTLTLRGISTNNTTEVGAPSVPVAIDEFVINRPSALYSTLFDVGQIQVLRGPQGTLFGRAASAGLIDVTTNQPSNDLEASGDLEFGNYNMVNVDGAFNAPVSETFQVRFAAMARRHNGYRQNTAPEQGSNPASPDDEDVKGGRVEMAWEPTDDFRGLLIYQSLNIDQAGFATRAIEFNYTDLALGVNSDISHAMPPLGNANAFPMYGPGQWYHHQDNVFKLQLHYRLPLGATLSYLGGYDKFDHNEVDSADPPWPTQLYPALGQYYPTPFNYTEKPATQNHELRIASKPGAAFQYQAGLYYFSENNHLFAQSLANPGSLFAEFVPNFGNAFLYQIYTRSKAGYGQVSYEFLPHNTLSLGGRYSKDSVHREGYFIAPSTYPPGPPSGYYFFQDSAASSSKFTYHIGYDWTPTKQTLVYGTVDSGYKPGAFSTCNSDTIPYQAETVTNFELGTKNMLEQRTLQLNFDVFYENYTNEQIATYSHQCSTGLVTTNAGKSRIYGAESDLIALVPHVGRLDFSLNYLNAKFVTFYGTPEIGAPALADCNVHNFYDSSGNLAAQQCNLAGNTLPQAPTITVSVGLEHTWLLSNEATFRVRAEGHYSSRQYLTVWNFPDETQGAYGTADLFLTYARDNWSIDAFARNLTNTVYLTFAQENAGGSDYLYSYGAPRVYGVRLAMHLDR